MKKSYSFLVALGVAIASLTSCSRSNYAFNNRVPAYLGSEKTELVAPPAPLPNSIDATTIVGAESTPALATVPVANATAPTAKPVKPTLVQRLVMKKLAKQLASVQVAKQNAVKVAKPASQAGNAGLVILAGAVIILIGGLIGGANIVVTIGGIVFVVGLVLLILALVRG